MTSSQPAAVTGTLTVEPFDVRVPVAPGERLLDAILRAGHYVAFGCNHGGCGTCAARLTDGQVDQRPDTLTTLDARARERGQVLLCSTRLVSPAVAVDIADSGITEEEFRSTTVHDVTTSIQQILHLAPRLRLLRLRRPRPPWHVRPGQFLHIELPDHTGWRAYSPASVPDAETVDLLIRTVPGGAFCTALDTLEPGDPIRCRGPFGTFTVRHSHRHKLFIGGGAGIGPLRAMVAAALDQRHNAPVDLVHVAHTDIDLAFTDEFHALAAQDRVAYHPLTRPRPGTRGTDLVADWLATTTVPLRRAEAYLCGPDGFVDTVAEHLLSAGLRPRYLAIDRFTASSGPTTDRASREKTMTDTPTSRSLQIIREAQAELDRLTPGQAAEALRHGVLFIDTRTSEEQAAEGTIPGAYRVPRNAVEVFLDPTHRPLFTPEEATDLPPVPGPDDKVIVLCNHGMASSLSAASLKRIGLNGATDVEGGFQAWKSAGLPITTES